MASRYYQNNALTTKAEVSDLLVVHPIDTVREVLASQTEEPDYLTVLAEDKTDEVRAALAHNPYISEKHIALLLNKPTSAIIGNLLSSRIPKASTRIEVQLSSFAKDLKIAVAKGSYLSENMEKTLREDGCEDVRVALVGNYSRTEETRKILSADASERVRSAVRCYY